MTVHEGNGVHVALGVPPDLANHAGKRLFVRFEIVDDYFTIRRQFARHPDRPAPSQNGQRVHAFNELAPVQVGADYLNWQFMLCSC